MYDIVGMEESWVGWLQKRHAGFWLCDLWWIEKCRSVVVSGKIPTWAGNGRVAARRVAEVEIVGYIITVVGLGTLCG